MHNAVNIVAVICIFIGACGSQPNSDPQQSSSTPAIAVPVPLDTLITVDGFDFPVGPPHAKGYYNAQAFGKNFHLGDDWNGVGGGNTDLGDTIYSVAHGKVVSAQVEGPGWGWVIRIKHRMQADAEVPFVESLYAHMDTIWVSTDSLIKRGQPIGTIGTAFGAYYAHLHLEIRRVPGLPLGGGYSQTLVSDSSFVDPTRFIRRNRP